MIRLVGILIGLGFAFVALVSLGVGAYTAATEDAPAYTTYDFVLHGDGPEGGFSFEGGLGRWDIAQLQRGYQVYKEVCAACHSLDYVAFRNLEQLGYSEDQVKAEAASWQVPGIDPDTGDSIMRPALPTDYFPSPYANDVAAAAANNNAIPPDLSLMTKARPDGTNYVYHLLIGYQEPSETLATNLPDALPGPGLYHNPYFPNLNIAMAPPITSDGQVSYNDGTEATIEQMSEDVSAFLTWTAEPSLIERKETGWAVLLFVLFATILAWFAKKQVWADIKPVRRKD
ncbi:cytochrome c1 [Aurantiacibacter gangjinensis]|uniref:Cytochrome c1 n=1 Tax=Aurantiacibacter gangjinensis TaxID=502682 RepID=A0A0G9MQU7_9SPHN|nr:cytochrome c1 [Aurantiacibacter gangjinensis]APE27605.1 ubiquinol cytochrome C oxidoreductase, cytochrome C1 subunit [Aurantiacibacter gangjinensis]KLE31638.1 cytochrome C [Aurantiacibacter gangjinensis]